MKLTNFTDYSFRALMYLALSPDRLCTVQEISKYFNVSKNHMVKVVHSLSKSGYIKTKKGKDGGITLARHAREINIGEIARHTESDFHLAECFKTDASNCKIKPACKLRNILFRAYQAFISELDQYTLDDITSNSSELQELIRQGS